MPDLSPAEIAERIEKLNQALQESKELQAELRTKMAARAGRDRQTVSKTSRTDSPGSANRR